MAATQCRDCALGYLAPDTGSAEWSLLLRSWTKDLIVFTQGRFGVSDELRRELDSAKIRIEERKVVGLRAELPREVLFVRPPQFQTPLVKRLGLRLDERDLVHTERFETSIPGS